MIKHFVVLIISILFLCSGCSTTVPRPLAFSAITTQSAHQLSTLSSAITLSFHSAEKHLSGRGVMVFQRPDQMRLVLLSPFGTTLMEALVNGSQLTLAYPGNGVAYQGLISQLPPAAGQKGWGLFQWVLATDPPAGAVANGTIVQRRERGGDETVTLKNGLVVEKSLASGERVRYQDYQQLQGIWLAMELLMETADGERIKLHLEDPELNTDLGSQAFLVRLDGLKLLPLSELKGP
jgi:outer membrane lipoprotein-sorting protein